MTMTSNDSRLADAMRHVMDQVSVDKVFGAPIERDGTVVIPVATVGGGAGGGGGETGPGKVEGETGSGGGAGVGLSAKPAGVFVLKDGEVDWKPAVDVNRIVLGGQLVLVVALLVARAVLRRRRR